MITASLSNAFTGSTWVTSSSVALATSLTALLPALNRQSGPRWHPRLGRALLVVGAALSTVLVVVGLAGVVVVGLPSFVLAQHAPCNPYVTTCY